jgi:nucleoside-diphosphate-sugar epimerase
MLVYSIAGMSEFLGKFSTKPPIFNFDKGRDFVQNFWTCSVEKAKNDFGFQQKVSLDDGLKSTVNWYKQNNWI